ncbi:UNVERIFIED_CONTAM: hypothetical protein GTU68_065436 [Idotea baltica]|nr:hypothetical protein [Idotea baltica]
MNFNLFNFDPKISKGIESEGFTTATPIQEKSIPAVLDKKDILGIAQTGTGKTAAFVLPMLQRLVSGQSNKIRGLIIAPTRELAVQIDEVIQSLGKHTGIKSILIFGGVSINPQINGLRKKVDIVVACPGRLIDHMQRKTIDLSALQGNLSQNRRQAVMKGFKSGEYKMLVATDIAARGIDISSISHVINYDVPSTPEIYTHRIGRTGRASKSGEAFTLVSLDDQKMIKAIEKLLGKPLESRKIEDFNYEQERLGDPSGKHQSPRVRNRNRFQGGNSNNGGNKGRRGGPQRARRSQGR